MTPWEAIDYWMVATAALTAVSCAIAGSCLLVRRMAMLGDAISHAVLPGLAIAFLVTASRDIGPMMTGGVAAGVATAVLTQVVMRSGRLEEHSSLGVVFTTLFALGLILISRVADRVDLDPSCVLYGALELTPLDTVSIGGWEVPRAFVISFGTMVMVAALARLLFKELILTAFDPVFAEVQGFRPVVLHYIVTAMTALAAVAGFETVGSILVVALLVVPAATARLFASRFPAMLIWSIALAVGSVVLGHAAALEIPPWFGFRDTNTAGMIAVANGAVFACALLFSPEYGWVFRAIRLARLRYRIRLEDALATLYRREKEGRAHAPLPAPAWLRRLGRKGWVIRDQGGWRLTGEGEERALSVIRSHRLWEQFLVERARMRPDQAHASSERLEHLTTPDLQESLDRDLERPRRDPQGREIPPLHLRG